MMEKWERADNYIGKDYSEYYVLYAHHRDSNILDESNYQALRKIFIELSGVIEVTSHHWGVGWVEFIGIHQDEKDTIELGNDYLDRIDDYPVLDDEDLSNREFELAENMAEDIFNEIEERRYFENGRWVEENLPEWISKDGFTTKMTYEEVLNHILDHQLVDW